MTKLYNELASNWYQLLTPHNEYKEESDLYYKIFSENAKPQIRTILELGSGAGHIAYYLKQWYKLTLSDISEKMLEISRKLNPDCAHIHGDMKSLRLNKTFDAVFIHDAIMYMTTEADLGKALETAFVHLKPGGILLISPDYIKETFKAETEQGGSDGEQNALRYLIWISDPDINDNVYTEDFIYAFKDASGEITTDHDRHLMGLFGKDTWLSLISSAGFSSRTIEDSYGRVNFLCFKNN
jgi:SAM-dependent methyltransferase